MKRILSGLIAALALAGCTSTGQVDPAAGARLGQDAVCILGAAALGAQISSGAGAAEAIKILQDASAGNPGLQGACAGLIGNLSQDAAGGLQRLQDAKAKAAAKPQL